MQGEHATKEIAVPGQDAYPPFTTQELSIFLWNEYRIQRSPMRLAKLRYTGGGPPFVRDGVQVRYPPPLARQWVEDLLGTPVRSTAEEIVTAIAADSIAPQRAPGDGGTR